MSRKSAALLASTPVKLDSVSRDFLKQLAKLPVEPGFEVQWDRYTAACRVAEEAHTRYDIVFRQVEKEGGTSSCKSWPAFIETGRAYERAAHAAMGALDAYFYAVKHKDDKTGVPEAEVRAIVLDSISDKLDGLDFSINTGLLGSKVAQAIHKLTEEASAGLPPFCADCQV